MVSLGDSFPDSFLASQIKVGTVILLHHCTEEDGITPKSGDKDRDKLFIILGSDEDYVFGCVVVNSNPYNKVNTTEDIEKYHYPILRRNNPSCFEHDSYANCMRLFEISIQKIRDRGKILGAISPVDLEYIVTTTIGAPTISKADIARFNVSMRIL